MMSFEEWRYSNEYCYPDQQEHESVEDYEARILAEYKKWKWYLEESQG